MDPNTVVSIVVPLEQDGLALEELVTEIDQTIGAAFRFFEIVLVDDGSTDGTSAVLDEIPNLHLVRHEKNRGYGAALKSAFEYALFASR